MTTLLIASAGGHLVQLHRLRDRLAITDDVVWITFDTPSARSLLEGETVEFAPHADPHDLVGTIKDAAFAAKILRKYDVSRAISTGANLAVAFLPFCRLRGAKSEYIESATRIDGPSLSGRMLQKVPGVDLYTQHEGWSDTRWTYKWCVFDGFHAVAKPAIPPVRKLVVTLGTNETYPFTRLVDRLRTIIPPSTEVLWQLGHTHSDITGAFVEISSDKLSQAMKDADAVVAHAGTGSALTAMDCGKFPLLVPRSKERGEHIDDHQNGTASWLQAKGLAMSVDASDLTRRDVAIAASWVVTRAT